MCEFLQKIRSDAKKPAASAVVAASSTLKRAVVLGANSVSRALTRGEASLVVVCREIPALVDHLPVQCAVSKCPLLVLGQRGASTTLGSALWPEAKRTVVALALKAPLDSVPGGAALAAALGKAAAVPEAPWLPAMRGIYDACTEAVDVTQKGASKGEERREKRKRRREKRERAQKRKGLDRSGRTAQRDAKKNISAPKPTASKPKRSEPKKI